MRVLITFNASTARCALDWADLAAGFECILDYALTHIGDGFPDSVGSRDDALKIGELAIDQMRNKVSCFGIVISLSPSVSPRMDDRSRFGDRRDDQELFGLDALDIALVARTGHFSRNSSLAAMVTAPSSSTFVPIQQVIPTSMFVAASFSLSQSSRACLLFRLIDKPNALVFCPVGDQLRDNLDERRLFHCHNVFSDIGEIDRASRIEANK